MQGKQIVSGEPCIYKGRHPTQTANDHLDIIAFSPIKWASFTPEKLSPPLLLAVRIAQRTMLECFDLFHIEQLCHRSLPNVKASPQRGFCGHL